MSTKSLDLLKYLYFLNDSVIQKFSNGWRSMRIFSLMREGIYYQCDHIAIIGRPISWPISLAANKLSLSIIIANKILIFSYFPHSFHLEKISLLRLHWLIITFTSPSLI